MEQEIGSLTARIVDLEMRVAFQEHTIQELSDALAASRMETTVLERKLNNVMTDLKQLRGLLYADPSTEPPPPHY
ncbi:SlyX family protein [Pseudomarimonas arenosa]|uniref:Protein SlyX homolog n=1 Tax=Pseudomarimonas arenosa TaxID=2774145 RepID=A0AAW3ZE77_9GAMM|nr:SlyX family protein [Pseudomarimonas arenosa]MBD8524550.1 SlyX family protein [Pseudomarimonas arenosa]